MNSEWKLHLRLRGVRWIVLAALVLVAAAGCSAPAEEDQPESGSRPVVTEEQYAALDDMNKHAERAYQSMKDGDVEEARTRMVQLSVVATKLSYEGLTSIEGMVAVTESIAAAIHSLNSVQPNEQESLMEVVRVRLAVDALAHRGQPLWLSFRKPVSDDLSELEQAVSKQDETAANRALKKWGTHVRLVHAAVLITKDASEAAKLDSITAFLENSVARKEWDRIAQSMPNLKTALEDIFRPEDQETILPLAPTEEPPHPIIWSLVLGSLIMAVLTYDAWRRYRAESAYVKVKKDRDIDGGY